MLVIYTPQITNRIRYIFDLFFKEQMQMPYKVTSSMDEFRVTEGPRIVYDSRPQEGCLCFGAVFLLFQRGISQQDLTVTEYNYLKIFYQIEGEDFILPFDPFAAAFYLVSRYEEYLPHANDRHDRFPPEESFAYRNGFLQVPVVNHYVKLVQLKIQEHYPELKFAPSKFKYKPTFDVDSAYNYRGKGPFRNLGGLARSVLQGNFSEAVDRVKVLSGRKKDPYDTYDYLLELHGKYDYKPVFFFLLGDYDEFDKGISINVTEFQSLIKSIADDAEVGIHPSYASNEDTTKLHREIRRLNRILKREIRISRQHFLKLKFPDTYRNLMDQDIEEDYTLGYAALPLRGAYNASKFAIEGLVDTLRLELSGSGIGRVGGGGFIPQPRGKRGERGIHDFGDGDRAEGDRFRRGAAKGRDGKQAMVSHGGVLLPGRRSGARRSRPPPLSWRAGSPRACVGRCGWTHSSGSPARWRISDGANRPPR